MKDYGELTSEDMDYLMSIHRFVMDLVRNARRIAGVRYAKGQTEVSDTFEDVSVIIAPNQRKNGWYSITIDGEQKTIRGWVRMWKYLRNQIQLKKGYQLTE